LQIDSGIFAALTHGTTCNCNCETYLL